MTTSTVEKRMVFFVQKTVKDNKGDFIACIAIEGESGYYLTDWTWGKDIAVAETCARKRNENMGISETESIKIVLGTMFPIKRNK